MFKFEIGKGGNKGCVFAVVTLHQSPHLESCEKTEISSEKKLWRKDKMKFASNAHWKKEHTVLTSTLCVVPHTLLSKEMKQPHGKNTGWKCQTKQKKNKNSTSSYQVYRCYCSLTKKKLSCVRCELYCVCSPPSWLNTHSAGHQKPSNTRLPKMLWDAKCSWTIGK